MQVALNMATPPPLFYSVTPNATNSFKLPTILPLSQKPTSSTAAGLRSSPLKASAAAVYETVDYNTAFSVFPAEACETIGGDACLADIFPEVKLQAQATMASNRRNSELVDRDYLLYNDPKTVLLGEACDVLGGEFCEPAYQRGIF